MSDYQRRRDWVHRDSNKKEEAKKVTKNGGTKTT